MKIRAAACIARHAERIRDTGLTVDDQRARSAGRARLLGPIVDQIAQACTDRVRELRER